MREASEQEKEPIRERMRAVRAGLTPEWVQATSLRIAERFIALEVYRAAETVCLYLAIAGEVCLARVIADCREQGKRVLVPAYRKGSGSYGFKQLADDTALAVGIWGVPEPAVAEWAEVGASACIAVPGVAFGGSGGRVGHGKGYYDRLLAFTVGDSRFSRIGVCFDFQRVETVPCEAWDVGMDMIVSESRVTRC